MNFFKSLFKKSGERISNIENEMHPEWDEVFYARTSNDLEKMLKVTDKKTTLVNRHFLLQTIVDESYKLREQEKYRDICLKYAEIHLTEFGEIAPALKKDFDGVLPRISTFQNYSMVLSEIGEYEKAIRVCQMAISFNLDDGTKSGYDGRIERIKKKINSPAHNSKQAPIA